MADDKIRIQWFPGHMTKAKREMQEKLSMVDMVIELRDARIPNASKNPMIEELCQNKPRLIVLSKKDKADAAATALWCKQLRNETTRVVALDIPVSYTHLDVYKRQGYIWIVQGWMVQAYSLHIRWMSIPYQSINNIWLNFKNSFKI